jgi:Family of unknown function (DUF5670)
MANRALAAGEDLYGDRPNRVPTNPANCCDARPSSRKGSIGSETGAESQTTRGFFLPSMQAAARVWPQGASCMWIGIGILLLLLWAGGFLAFHVAGFLIHILLICAVVAFVLHFITGRRTAV